MKKLLFMIVCVTLLCACGGGESKPQPTEESKNLPSLSLVLKGKHAKLYGGQKEKYNGDLVSGCKIAS